jgi:hypothetical protein
MITQSKNLTVLSVVALGCGIAAVGFTGVAQGSRVVGAIELSRPDVAGQRIANAFKAASEAPANRKIAIAAARKGDLQIKRCAAERWPAVSADCVIADGVPTRPVSRTVTVEYRTGAESSMLVRMPVELVAAR